MGQFGSPLVGKELFPPMGQPILGCRPMGEAWGPTLGAPGPRWGAPNPRAPYLGMAAASSGPRGPWGLLPRPIISGDPLTSLCDFWSCLLCSLPLLSPSRVVPIVWNKHTGIEFSTIRTSSCCWDSGPADLLPQSRLDRDRESSSTPYVCETSDVLHLWH